MTGRVLLIFRYDDYSDPSPTELEVEVASLFATHGMAVTYGVIPFTPADTVVVEIHNADFQASGGHSFFVGMNTGGQTNPGYFSTNGCGGPVVPTDIGSLGSADHMIIDLNFIIPNQVIDYPGS